MSIVSKSSSFSVRQFSGVNDLVDDVKLPAGLVGWSHGGQYNERGEFVRVNGKKLMSSNSTKWGPVLTVSQVDFADRRVVVSHASTVYELHTVSELSVLGVADSTRPLSGIIVQ